MFECTLCLYLQVIRIVCQTGFLILVLSIFSIYGLNLILPLKRQLPCFVAHGYIYINLLPGDWILSPSLSCLFPKITGTLGNMAFFFAKRVFSWISLFVFRQWKLCDRSCLINVEGTIHRLEKPKYANFSKLSAHLNTLQMSLTPDRGISTRKR